MTKTTEQRRPANPGRGRADLALFTESWQPHTEEKYERLFALPLPGQEHQYYFPVDAQEERRQKGANQVIWKALRPLETLPQAPEGNFIDLGA